MSPNGSGSFVALSLRIKKALGIFRERIPIATRRTTRVAFGTRLHIVQKLGISTADRWLTLASCFDVETITSNLADERFLLCDY